MLLQHRAYWSHHGGTWGLPGGARDSHETATEAALREAAEETGVRASEVQVRAERLTMEIAQGWSYTTVIADAPRQLATQRNGESAELRWVVEHEVAALPLHPGFSASWPLLRAQPVRLLLDPVLLLDPAAAVGTQLFPRTLELPHGGFAWVRQAETGLALPAERPPDSRWVVVTADKDLRARLGPEVLVLDPAELTKWLG